MALRCYLVPKEQAPSPTTPGAMATWPAHFFSIGIRSFGAIDYGLEPVFLVRADVTNQQRNALIAFSDVDEFPANLDNTVGVNLATVTAALEAKGIPGDWVTSGMTYRAVLRWVARLFLIAQRLNGRAGLQLLSDQTLSSTVGDLSIAKRQALNEAAQSLGLDTSGVTLGMTIRQALKILGNQIEIPIALGGDL